MYILPKYSMLEKLQIAQKLQISRIWIYAKKAKITANMATSRYPLPGVGNNHLFLLGNRLARGWLCWAVGKGLWNKESAGGESAAAPYVQAPVFIQNPKPIHTQSYPVIPQKPQSSQGKIMRTNERATIFRLATQLMQLQWYQ